MIEKCNQLQEPYNFICEKRVREGSLKNESEIIVEFGKDMTSKVKGVGVRYK